MISTARKDAHAFRGAFLDKYARLERSLTPALVRAATIPEYKAIVAKRPHLFGQKIAVLREIMDVEGRLKAALSNMAAALDELARYDETRTFMSHAVVDIAQTEHDETLYIFRLTKLTKDGADQATLTIASDDAILITKRLGAVVNLIVRDLDAVGRAPLGNITVLPTVTGLSPGRTPPL